MKKDINSQKIFYVATIFSVLLFIFGFFVLDFNSLNNFGLDISHTEYFEMLILLIPIAMWAWLIIFGILFVKKNWIVRTICIVLAIPHIFFIVLLHAFSYSVVEILKWYVMILSFGIII